MVIWRVRGFCQSVVIEGVPCETLSTQQQPSYYFPLLVNCSPPLLLRHRQSQITHSLPFVAFSHIVIITHLALIDPTACRRSLTPLIPLARSSSPISGHTSDHSLESPRSKLDWCLKIVHRHSASSEQDHHSPLALLVSHLGSIVSSPSYPLPLHSHHTPSVSITSHDRPRNAIYTQRIHRHTTKRTIDQLQLLHCNLITCSITLPSCHHPRDRPQHCAFPPIWRPPQSSPLTPIPPPLTSPPLSVG